MAIPSYALSSNLFSAGSQARIVFVTPTENSLTLTLSITGTDISGQSGSAQQQYGIATGSSYYNFVVPTSLLTYMPSSKTKAITLTLTDGTTTKTETCTLKADGNAYAPTGCVLSMEPVSSVVPAAWGKYVEGHSKAKLTITTAATARYGAGISNYKLYMTMAGAAGQIDTKNVAGQVTAPYSWTPTMDESDLTGDPSFIVYAYDTRGNYSIFIVSATLTPYQGPDIWDMTVKRCDANGDDDDAGTYALVKVTPGISSCDGLNQLGTITCKYRRKGVSAWTDAGTLSEDPNDPGVYTAVVGGGNLAANKNWQIDIIVPDLVDQAERYRQLSIAYMEMHIAKGGGAWAFGGVADTPGSLHIWGGLKLDTALPISSGGTGATTASAARTNLGIADLLVRSQKDGTWASNSSYIGTTYTFSCRRTGLMATIYLDFNKSSTSTGSDFQDIGTIPSGYRPIETVYQGATIQAANAHVTLRLYHNGALALYGNHTTSGRVRLVITYPIHTDNL